ncbi:alkaline phosphatase [Anaerosacchariphilus polymeriproducens]|uniref:Alkaline phosphatase n=1 Tax=Anaerosacchariphilus polymeriproducens TaxID=1812858 RepID=A0A371AR43_9FIRM|nr:alkaline phosphatase [Anaerosacchariphilus polymeriproducens]RDU22056.1 alkaline phosphatase [Anaerosacchariphilus polymeriproducens]
MKKRRNFILSMVSIAVLCVNLLAGCGNTGNKPSASGNNPKAEAEVSQTTAKKEEVKAPPKYVFLFIGDGMSFPQIQSASYYLGALENDGKVEDKKLSFMDFPVIGNAKTFDKTSFITDSASAVTAIATGNKTSSGTINMDESFTKKYESIAEKLKKQLGYKIGILTSVNINHATPAGFYAHQDSRDNYYEIGEELAKSGFDYFAGGGFKEPAGDKEDQKSLYDLAQENGYKVIKTQEEAKKLKAEDGKTLIVAETLADSDSMNYQIDAKEDEWKLADYVQKGIEVLDNDKGFFMMAEGGKIDWACHSNDAVASIHDTIALSNAVKKALEFYEKHPDETLILVTADHETGGLSLGDAGTNYDTYLKNLQKQRISFAKFDKEYVSKYKENKTDFSTVLKDIKDNFGLMSSDDADAAKEPSIVFTEYELNLLKEAYERTLSVGTAKQEDMSQEEYELYGTCEPLTVTVTHLLDNKSGLSFNSYSHTGLPVPVYAIGSGAQQFGGYYDNTDIFKKLVELSEVK